MKGIFESLKGIKKDKKGNSTITDMALLNKSYAHSAIRLGQALKEADWLIGESINKTITT
jgi:hypothetical protein